VHKLGGAFFFCLQGIGLKTGFKMPKLWDWIRRDRAVAKNGKVDPTMAFLLRAGKFGYIGINKKVR
jgi:hypothetical protein